MTSPFPPHFFWGAATASYQIEGGVNEDGRGQSIWDTFCRIPGKISDGSSGDVACDHYHRWREDIGLMQAIGLNAYRFSIAWPRILPEGTGDVNQRGLDFYDRLVDGLLEAGITPFATLYHWDLPQALEDRGGWLNRETAYAFAHYTDVVTRRLGDRVRHWMTLNEPWVYCIHGYKSGWYAPGHTTGDDWTGVLSAIHHSLLAHGEAVPVIRRNGGSKAQAGIVLNLSSIEPVDGQPENAAAARRLDGALNRWFLDALFRGSYPQDLVDLYGTMAPTPQVEDMSTIAAPLDFLGVNYYTREVVAHDDHDNGLLRHRKLHSRDGEHPECWAPSFERLLVRLKNEYSPNAIYITENGFWVPDEALADGEVRDYKRIAYLRDHIAAVGHAVQAGVPMRGYFIWSLLDDFEWSGGYQGRLGLHYVDYSTQQRIPKHSAHWYRKVIRTNGAHLTELVQS